MWTPLSIARVYTHMAHGGTTERIRGGFIGPWGLVLVIENAWEDELMPGRKTKGVGPDSEGGGAWVW
jgi:hypothetical protein